MIVVSHAARLIAALEQRPGDLSLHYDRAREAARRDAPRERRSARAAPLAVAGALSAVRPSSLRAGRAVPRIPACLSPSPRSTSAASPRCRLPHADGASCTVALHGGHVLSWSTPDGVERLYLSPEAVLRRPSRDPRRRAGLLAAVQPARPAAQARLRAQPGLAARGMPIAAAPLVLALRDNDATTRALWPHAFGRGCDADARRRTAAHRARRRTTPATRALDFTAALHSYLRVDDIAEVAARGPARREALGLRCATAA